MRLTALSRAATTHRHLTALRPSHLPLPGAALSPPSVHIRPPQRPYSRQTPPPTPTPPPPQYAHHNPSIAARLQAPTWDGVFSVVSGVLSEYAESRRHDTHHRPQQKDLPEGYVNVLLECCDALDTLLGRQDRAPHDGRPTHHAGHLLHMLCTMTVQRDPGTVPRAMPRRWFHDSMQALMELIVETEGESPQSSSSSSDPSESRQPLFGEAVIMTIAGAMRSMPPIMIDGESMYMVMDEWAQTFLCPGDDSSGRSPALQKAIDEGRAHLKGQKEMQLVVITLDSIIVHNGANREETAKMVEAFLRKLADARPDLRVSSAALPAIIFKCTAMDPAVKVKYFIRALEQEKEQQVEDGTEPISDEQEVDSNCLSISYYLADILLDCTQKEDWKTALEATNAMVQFRIPMNHLIAIRMMGIFEKRGQLGKIVRYFEHLKPDSAKWHGELLGWLLATFVVNRMNDQWYQLVKDILQRSEEFHRGSWPTAFFSTDAQRQKFIKTSNSMLRFLQRQKRIDPNKNMLAERWNAFVADQISVYGDDTGGLWPEPSSLKRE